MKSKPFYKSKVLWFNALAIIGIVAANFGYADFKPNPDLLQLAELLVAIVNIVLRLVTSKSVTI